MKKTYDYFASYKLNNHPSGITSIEFTATSFLQ
jgi:hypothetical protein